ncbi:YkyA family protein [Sporosarcina sp. JAI121]|uniref:YkyA family protein n=1 Tax=Sporosarcina sp. JAI121 TaxID=2723064 RepID=UPI0015C75A26|nr:YkyA family protein [Sporosarcina sp. JAI121]NYF24084.1 chromosome segregation ATPase [Sporosarcina sp. JAI121]
MKKTVIVLILAVMFVLSGCSFGSSVEKMLSDTMSKMTSEEKGYRDAQKDLTELEIKEQKLFNDTMELTKEQQDELTASVTQLKDLLDQRLAHIEAEQKSMNQAKGSADDFDDIVEQADESDKKNIEGLKAAVINRYKLHSDFISAYKDLTALQNELYAMLDAEETNLTELRGKVSEVNAQNDTVKTVIASFNDATEKVNVQKDDVFAGLRKEE